MIQIAQPVTSVLYELIDAGFEAYLVGGFVRDALRGTASVDIDISTSATISWLEEYFSYRNPQVHAAFYTLSFKVGVYQFEITQFRRDFDYVDQRHPQRVIPVSTLEEDAQRRDFTINALYYHPLTGMHDPTGGLDDLRRGILRSIGNPHESFESDALRMVRLYRFQAEFDFEIEYETKKAALSMIQHLETYPSHWVYKELTKYLCAPHFVKVSLLHPQCLCALIPRLKEALTLDQENPYHRYTLYEHTVRVVGCVNDELLKLVALFHDLGKLDVKVMDGVRARYPNHAHHSMLLAAYYFELWQIPKKERMESLKLIEYHDYDLGDTMESMAHAVIKFGVPFVTKLIQFKRCDNRAKSEKAAYQITRCKHYDDALTVLKSKRLERIKDLNISGDALDFIPHQERGKVLEALFVAVATDKVANEINALREYVGGHYDIY